MWAAASARRAVGHRRIHAHMHSCTGACAGTHRSISLHAYVLIGMPHSPPPAHPDKVQSHCCSAEGSHMPLLLPPSALTGAASAIARRRRRASPTPRCDAVACWQQGRGRGGVWVVGCGPPPLQGGQWGTAAYMHICTRAQAHVQAHTDPSLCMYTYSLACPTLHLLPTLTKCPPIVAVCRGRRCLFFFHRPL